MKRLNAKRAPWLRAAVVITLVACAFATLAGCTAAPKVEVESSQVQSDFEAFADTLSDNLVQSPYVDNGDYALTAFDVSDSHVADDGANVFDATATFENGSFRTTMDVVATYAKDGDSYTPSFEVSNTSTKATSGIKYDPQGTLGASIRKTSRASTSTRMPKRAPSRQSTNPNGLKACRATWNTFTASTARRGLKTLARTGCPQ